MKVLALIVAMFAALSAPGFGDLTASSVDRTAFEACQDAEGRMRESADMFADASSKCGIALIHYSKELQDASDGETRCHSALYAGSSAILYGYVVSKSASPGHSNKLYALGETLLRGVLSNCPDDPNMLRAAKGELAGLATIRSK